VFTGPRGAPLRRKVWQGHWNAARRAVELPAGFRFHDLRHTANTITAATSASARELMARMGHRSNAAALRYQHATRERDRAIAGELGAIIHDARSTRDERASGPD
jgi:integrase